MSLSKRIFIDKDPDFESVRREWATQTEVYLQGFEFRIAGRRRNHLRSRPHWDPLWPSSLSQAAERLEIEVVWINKGLFTRSREQRTAVQTLAEEIWHEKLARFPRQNPL